MTLSHSAEDDILDVQPRILPADGVISSPGSAQEVKVLPLGSEQNPRSATVVRPTARFLRSHLAHWLALGTGSGLSPLAPGTIGSLWAWLLWWPISLWLTTTQQGVWIAITGVLACWSSAVAATHLGSADPKAIVIDEMIAFWLVLWLLLPASFGAQLAAFALFRFFDTVKPGPIGWADRLLHSAKGWLSGVGIVLDDMVAAFCTLLVIALWRA